MKNEEKSFGDIEFVQKSVFFIYVCVCVMCSCTLKQAVLSMLGECERECGFQCEKGV